jgi:hypothetical protein
MARAYALRKLADTNCSIQVIYAPLAAGLLKPLPGDRELAEEISNAMETDAIER